MIVLLKIIVKMGNLCGDTVLQTSVSGALLGHSSDVFDFKYGVDVYHPVV